jgi:type IV pilus assembly protein PilC
MPLYKYTARNKSGQEKSGEMSAPDERALALLLREQGWLLTGSLAVGGSDGKKKKSVLSLELGGVPMIQRILFTQHLGIMLDSGLSLGKALRVLSQQAGKKYFSEVIIGLQKKVEQGTSFADALKNYPKVFPPVYVNMVKLGETSGNLSKVLRELAVQMKKTYDLTRKIKGAMYYPGVILITFIGIGIMLIVYVLPKLVDVFEGIGGELPLTTQLLIKGSKFFNANWLWIAIGLGLLITLLIVGIRTNRGKKGLGTVGLKVPKVGDIIKKINIARFCRTFSSLLKSGVPIVDSLEIVADTLGNVRYHDAVIAASKTVKTGTAISQSFKNVDDIFPPIVTQIMNVGEETGTLDEVLTQLADFYEEEVAQEMDNLSSIIEPIMMLVLGGGVALLAISIIGPIYSLSGQM